MDLKIIQLFFYIVSFKSKFQKKIKKKFCCRQKCITGFICIGSFNFGCNPIIPQPIQLQPIPQPQPQIIYPDFWWYWQYPGFEDIFNGGQLTTSEPIIENTTKKPTKKPTKQTTKTPTIPPVTIPPVTIPPVTIPPVTIRPTNSTIPPVTIRPTNSTLPPIVLPPTNATTPRIPVTTEELSLN